MASREPTPTEDIWCKGCERYLDTRCPIHDPVETGGFECREDGCTNDALVSSYYCPKHEEKR